MTSRPVSEHGTTPPRTASPVGPRGRPHLPPVAGAATSRRSDRKAPLAWLPWLLLGLLALTLLAAALLAKAAGGSDDATSGSSQQSGARGSDPGAAAPQPGGDASGAALSAGGQDLLGLAGGSLVPLQGQQVSGTSRVESVVADEGFWVGSDATRRVFVFLTPAARRSAGESGFQVEAGQAVQLAGTVKASSPQFASAAGVTDAEGARQLVQQGGYVEATGVRLAP
jgi:hypothetical protein